MNVNSIKATTPVTSFINVADVEEKTNTYLNNLEKVLNKLENRIDKEVREGGLSIYAYNRGGDAPFMVGHANSAETIYKDIEDVRAEIDGVRESIYVSAKKHKLDEYEMLKNKTNAYIKSLQEIMDQKADALEKAMESKDPTAISTATAEYDEAKANFDTWNEKIAEYDKKIKSLS